MKDHVQHNLTLNLKVKSRSSMKVTHMEVGGINPLTLRILETKTNLVL